MEELPNDFDVVVVGTGLPESILAAACARLGWTVLHLDRNEYYGADWTNFNFESLERWVTEQSAFNLNAQDVLPELSDFPLEPGETFMPIGVPIRKFENIESAWHIAESARLPVPTDGPTSTQPQVESQVEAEEENAIESAPKVEKALEPAIIESAPLTRNIITDNWRKFSLDLAPKMLLSRGSFIELLISSGVSRYAEFKLVNRILTRKSDDQTFEVVPCSRSDVFQNKNISMIEKRLLMKFLNSCLNIENEPTVCEEAQSLTFSEFLDKKGLTPNLMHFIITSIAMVASNSPAMEGVKSVKSFLMSTGRYGNSPFLFTCYGCGELPQCFCRMCAVFGGIYCLRRSCEAIILDSNRRICGIVSQGNRITCRAFIAESSYLPITWKENLQAEKQFLSRAILITNASVLPDTKDHLSVFSLPASHLKVPVTVLESSHSAFVCPKSLYVVYLCVPSECSTAKEDLSPVVSELFATSDNSNEKPRVLWSLYYNQVRHFISDSNLTECPENLIVTSGPSESKDLDDIVENVKMAFDRLWPGEDFLPAVPNPEEPSLDENDPGINGFTPDPGSEVKNLPAEVANVVEESPVQPEIFTPVSENSN